MDFRQPRRQLVCCLLAGIVLAPGCTVCEYAKLVSVEEPKLFNRKCDRKATLATYRALADEAWAIAGACCPEGFIQGDYAWGFREGFAEYVYAGGNGETTGGATATVLAGRYEIARGGDYRAELVRRLPARCDCGKARRIPEDSDCRGLGFGAWTATRAAALTEAPSPYASARQPRRDLHRSLKATLNSN